MTEGLTKLLLKVGAGIVVLVLGIVLVSHMITTVAADEIVVKQDVFGGGLQVWSTPGVHWQNFGLITRYKKSAQYWFSVKKDEGKDNDESIKVRFSDGGHGNVSGSMRYNLPTDNAKMLKLHSTYGSMEKVDHDLVRQVVSKSVYMTGPLMSSRESYAEKRADLINFITDQVLHGVYRTERKQTKTIDPISGQEKNVDYMEPKLNGTAPNGVEREEESPIEQFGLTAYNITVNSIEYDAQVEEQIKFAQAALMSVQQSMIDAKKAEQNAITVSKQGEAEAAKAKWAQEVIKATEMTKAQQEKDVATLQAEKNKAVASLSLDTAKLAAQETITTAKADAEAKRMAMAADNALDKKLEVYKAVSIAWANAYGNQRQTPDVQMGSGSNGGMTPQLVDILTAKTARDLNVSTK